MKNDTKHTQTRKTVDNSKLQIKIEKKNIKKNNYIDINCNKNKKFIEQSARKTLATQTISRTQKQKTNLLWFCKEIQKKCQKKPICKT